MTKLTPIKLDNNTVIYIETTEGAIAPAVTQPQSPQNSEEESPVTRGLPSVKETQELATQSFQAIEGTIRAYTTYTLNAFNNSPVRIKRL